MALTARTLLHGPASHFCTSGTSRGTLSPSHGLNVLVHGALLVVVAAAMAVTGMAVAVAATWEGAWPGRCKGMQGRAGRGGVKREGSRGGTVEGANGSLMISLFCAMDTREMHMLIFKNSENPSAVAMACEICSMKWAGHAHVAGTRKFIEVNFLFRRQNGTTSPGTWLHVHSRFCACPPVRAPSLCSAWPC